MVVFVFDQKKISLRSHLKFSVQGKANSATTSWKLHFFQVLQHCGCRILALHGMRFHAKRPLQTRFISHEPKWMSKQKEYGELITEELTHLITISLALTCCILPQNLKKCNLQLCLPEIRKEIQMNDDTTKFLFNFL